ncbi:GntR family transcriptional regulator [Microbacterium sp. H37-C3]|uniref:FadR/GntR family transcriptional regulator n=1 Tax=Microbacterium sp. H37-C3 TaxID=3004354 RepID=UPI0022AEE1BC|nr:GntR family transcriptional regulator [Microbacterium sp. H37-C3]MCZ4068995.1 GntR family transcriptional regulator [Microbacterium sp. H37-C3]
MHWRARQPATGKDSPAPRTSRHSLPPNPSPGETSAGASTSRLACRPCPCPPAGPLRRALFSDAVRALEARIVEMDPGDRLDGEPRLAEQLGVSRLTMREALKVLEGRRLIDLAKGKRPTVRAADGSVIARDLSLAVRRDARAANKLLVVRRSLEVLSSGEAARNAGRAGLAALEATVAEMERIAERFDGSDQHIAAYNAADVAFHEPSRSSAETDARGARRRPRRGA